MPALRRNASGPSWTPGHMGEGKTLDLAKDFLVAEPGMPAKELNAALAAGRNLLFAPGIHHMAEPLRVTKANTVLLGLGEATIVPDNAKAGLICADVDGVTIAGLIFDAERASRRFLVMGERKTAVRHAANPSFLTDVIYRVGGTGKPGKTEVALEINANDVIVDHTWIWRADHGAYTGWTANTSKNGLVVNGDHVTCYGLFVEHFQEYDVLWNGEDGRTFFLQNEKCYDPPGNAAWMSHDGRKKGYAAYKVAPKVTKHRAIGLGVYDVFINTGGKKFSRQDYIRYQRQQSGKNSFDKDYFKSSGSKKQEPKAEKQTTTRKTTTDSGVTIIDDRESEEKKKIFDNNDGEYVEFEEIHD